MVASLVTLKLVPPESRLDIAAFHLASEIITWSLSFKPLPLKLLHGLCPLSLL